MDISDQEVARKVQNGEDEYFAILMSRYESKISRYLKKFLWDEDDALDVLQEVFLKSYINIASFDTSQSFSPWIYRIAHNEAINFLKKKKPDTISLFDVDVLFPHPIAREQADRETENTLTKNNLESVLGDIPIKYREVLILYFIEELSYKEISRVLKIPVSSVGVRINRAKEKVESIYKQKGLTN